MTEKEAIKGIERLIKWFEKWNKDYVLFPEDKVYFETVLNLIKKQDKMINDMALNIKELADLDYSIKEIIENFERKFKQ